MRIDPIVVFRKHGPQWAFEWDEYQQEYKYRGRKYQYTLFFPAGELAPKIWIGRWVGVGYISVEQLIGAKSIAFFGGHYRFGGEP